MTDRRGGRSWPPRSREWTKRSVSILLSVGRLAELCCMVERVMPGTVCSRTSVSSWRSARAISISALRRMMSCRVSHRAGQQASALPLLLWGFFLCWCVWQPERTGAVTPVTRVGSLIRSAAKRVFSFLLFLFFIHPPSRRPRDRHELAVIVTEEVTSRLCPVCCAGMSGGGGKKGRHQGAACMYDQGAIGAVPEVLKKGLAGLVQFPVPLLRGTLQCQPSLSTCRDLGIWAGRLVQMSPLCV